MPTDDRGTQVLERLVETAVAYIESPATSRKASWPTPEREAALLELRRQVEAARYVGLIR